MTGKWDKNQIKSMTTEIKPEQSGLKQTVA